jgi:5'-3' exonuclease
MTLRHVVVDVGGLSYWKLHSLASKSKCEQLGLVKEAILAMESEGGFKEWVYDVKMEILDIIQSFNPDFLTLACDGKNLWRKEIFPEYKDNRKSTKAKIPIDWNLFYNTRDKLMRDIAANMPIKTILLDHIEADDIVTVLVEHLNETHEIIALSNDSDWHQLFKYPNFRVFKINDNSATAYFSRGPEGRTEVVGVDPVKLIQMKILTGDTGDNIPNLKPRLGEKTAEKIILESQGNIYAYALNEGLLDAFERNQRLINLDRIPQNIKDLIWNTYTSTPISEVDHLLLSDFYPENYDLIAQMSHLNIFSQKNVKNLGW